jgi:hypothetical protein
MTTASRRSRYASLTETIARQERRSATRTMTIYRLVQVAHDGDEGLARCRNISDTGMRLDVKMPMAVNDKVRVTFSPTFALSGRIVWREGSDCGVAFERPIDCAELLHRSALEARTETREHTLNAHLPASVLVDGRTCPTLVSDISQHAMTLTQDGTLTPGLRVWIILQCGAEKAGVVQWVDDSSAGVMLLDPFSVDDLGSIRALELSCGKRRDD